MRFYRVHRETVADGSVGYDWFTTEREAVRFADRWRADNGDDAGVAVDAIDINPTKAGILAALNRYAHHADNG